MESVVDNEKKSVVGNSRGGEMLTHLSVMGREVRCSINKETRKEWRPGEIHLALVVAPYFTSNEGRHVKVKCLYEGAEKITIPWEALAVVFSIGRKQTVWARFSFRSPVEGEAIIWNVPGGDDVEFDISLAVASTPLSRFGAA